MRKKDIKLYNVLFPIWMLWLFPITWIVILPGNFLIDLTVVALTLKVMKTKDVKNRVKKVIWKVWLFGFAADIIGCAAMYSVNLIDFNYQSRMGKWWYENLSSPVNYNPFDSIFGFLWVTVCIIIAAVFIYWFNYRFALKNSGLEMGSKKKLALSLAIFTAPYLFYVPSAWIY